MEDIKIKEGEQKIKKFSVIDFYKQYSFWINCLILIGLFLGNCFLSYFTFIAYSFVLILVIISEINIAISYLFFTFAFNSIYLPYSPISFGVCVFAMMVKLFIIKFKEDKSNFKVSKTTIILFIAFFVYLLLPIKREFDFAYVLRALYLLLGAVLVCFFAKFSRDFNWRYNLKIALISFIMSCGFAFFHNISPLLKITQSDWWVGEYFSGFGALMFNPNTLAMFCLVAVTIFVYYAMKADFNWLDALTILGYLIIGIVTKSRAFYVIGFINLLVLFVVGIKKKNKNILFMFLGLLVIVALLYVVNFDYFVKVFEDFKINEENCDNINSALSDFTSTRTDLWCIYFKEWKKSAISIIFGKGVSSPIITTYSPHNMYFTMLYQLGVIGAILFISLIVFVIKDSLKGQPKVGKAMIIPLISFLMLAIVEDMFFYMF